MEIAIVAAALLLVVYWLLRKRPPQGDDLGGQTDAARSALAALNESDDVCLVSWRRIGELIEEADASGDADELCQLMVRGPRDRLPPEIKKLWIYLDDISARSNRRAEHYESVSGKAAPPSRARAYSDRLMEIVRTKAKAFEVSHAANAAGSKRPVAPVSAQEPSASGALFLPMPPDLPAQVVAGARDKFFLLFFSCLGIAMTRRRENTIDEVVAACRDSIIDHIEKPARVAVLATYRASVLRRFVQAWSREVRRIAARTVAKASVVDSSPEELALDAARALADLPSFREQTATLQAGSDSHTLMLALPGRLARDEYLGDLKVSGRSPKEWLSEVERQLKSGDVETV